MIDMNMVEGFGFKLELSQPVEEIEGTAYVFRHATGARLLYLQNDDNNKGFSITFKTPANDDTGVFHILEHSVLCGSEKYPVKEPFVNLLKNSMQTFLNAMTFPDKTMYPVASTNMRDLLNLTSVYLDAVFHPNIYTNRRIFEQEGWHLECGPKEEGNLEYNGVVFNEMKGALSDSDSVLFDTLSAALFPDTAYRFESGGTPDAIPTLDYESFLDTHARHYRPSNSYIVLYGNMDLEPFLELIDSSLRSAKNDSTPINALDLQSPVCNMAVKRKMQTSPDSSCAALGFVVAQAKDRERIAAIQILFDAIMGSNEAPMKKALLASGIADEYEGAPVSSLAQPFVVLTARGLHSEDALSKLEAAVAHEAKRLYEGGLSEDIVEAALNHAEFSIREGDFGVADGVYYSISAMLGWLYDDSPESALLYIRYEEILRSLREKLGTGYFANLISEIFLENKHKASAEVIPVEDVEDCPSSLRLKELESTLSASQFEEIDIEANALHEAQMAPDAEIDVAKLPTLSREDVDSPAEEPKCHIFDLGQLKVMRHDLDTHGIVYVSKYFDLGCLTFDDLPYVSILSMVLGKMDTEAHTATEIDTLVQSELGSLSFSCDTYASSEGAKDVRSVLVVRASCLASKILSLCDLVNEILTTTLFNDRTRLENILTQFKVGKEQQFVMSGDGVASTRAASYIYPSARLVEQTANIDFYQFVKGMLVDFDSAADSLANKLRDLAKIVFTDDDCLLSFAGCDEAFESYCESGALLGTNPDKPKDILKIPTFKPKDEAFAVPADIAYCALVYDRSKVDMPLAEFSGIWAIAARVLSFDYLWNEVRVVGGAYGVKFNSTRLGLTTFSSFRDPHVNETFDRFCTSGEWLAKFHPHKDEFEGYVVSTAASFDKPLKTKGLIHRQVSMYLGGYSYEEYLQHRQEVLDAKLSDLLALSEPISKICEQANRCVIGNKALIEQSGLDVPIVDLIGI